MSSALERLKALAAAKKAADEGVKKDESKAAPSGDPQEQVSPAVAEVQGSSNLSAVSEGTAAMEASEGEVSLVQSQANVEVPVQSGTISDHPLVMELAELEQQLNQKVPDFRLTLRNIHQKLRNDPELVTALSEEEIGLIVSGLATHANAAIVAPKAVRAAKATAKKTPINADDL